MTGKTAFCALLAFLGFENSICNGENVVVGHWVNSSFERIEIEGCEYNRIKRHTLDVSPSQNEQFVDTAFYLVTYWDIPSTPSLCSEELRLQSASWPVEGRYSEESFSLSRLFGSCDIGDCESIPLSPGAFYPKLMSPTSLAIRTIDDQNAETTIMVLADHVGSWFHEESFKVANREAKFHLSAMYDLKLVSSPTAQLALMDRYGTPSGLFFIQSAKKVDDASQKINSVAVFVRFGKEGHSPEIHSAVFH